jgi:hypothetical protein
LHPNDAAHAARRATPPAVDEPMPPLLTPRHAATPDPELEARVVTRIPLRYAEGAHEELDRPAHVRAASSMAWIDGRIALVQDDANFIALIDPRGGEARAITLPAGEGGRRQFDDGRGNKRFKLDLEACVSVRADDRTLLFAFGSGSSDRRERVAVVTGWEREEPDVKLTHVPRLYAALRDEAAFAGSELNVEGAVQLGDRLRLFARGNGAARGDVTAANATCDLHWPTLLAHLAAPDDTDPPTPLDVVRYELGLLDGISLTFTDATQWGERILFSAAAEDSPDAVTDGRVAGSALGVIEADGRTRWTPLVEPSGALFSGKVEGVLRDPEARDRLLVVVDADDPDVPSELCTVELRGAWAG